MTRNVKLDDDVYSRCLATAKGYYTMLRRRKKIEDEIIHAGHCPDGQPRGNGIRNPTARKAERIICLLYTSVDSIRIEDMEDYIAFNYSGGADFEDIGKTVFLTREEAEAALRRGRNG